MEGKLNLSGIRTQNVWDWKKYANDSLSSLYCNGFKSRHNATNLRNKGFVEYLSGILFYRLRKLNTKIDSKEFELKMWRTGTNTEN